MYLDRSRVRFIPACAGNTPGSPGLAGPESAYGSSPRARGTRLLLYLRVCQERFIPACAGNTLLFRSIFQRIIGSSPRARGTQKSMAESQGTGTVHPRVRGERGSLGHGWTYVVGSSPRARGTHGSRDRSDRCQRFIPACAGNTRLAACRRSARSVHPRVRGEHASTLDPRPDPPGSSPRARGTLFDGLPVHPRVRGEHQFVVVHVRPVAGSSPRARGTLRDL